MAPRKKSTLGTNEAPPIAADSPNVIEFAAQPSKPSNEEQVARTYPLSPAMRAEVIRLKETAEKSAAETRKEVATFHSFLRYLATELGVPDDGSYSISQDLNQFGPVPRQENDGRR